MTLLSLGQPLLLSSGLVGPALLGIGLSAGVFTGLVGYALHKRSLETGESYPVLLTQLRADLVATVERARSRWRSGAVRATWRSHRRNVLRVGAALLAGEGVLVGSIATSKGGFLGEGNIWFAGTVVVLACLLANSVLGLLWLAGPKPEQKEQHFYSHNGEQLAAGKPLHLFGRPAAALAAPEPRALPEAQ